MRHLFIGLLLLTGKSMAWSQEAPRIPDKEPKHQIKVSLFDMIDPFSPSFLLGYEQLFTPNFSMMLEGGPASSFDSRWVMSDDLKGYKMRGEMRFTLDRSNSNERFYLGLQAMYKHTKKYNLTGNFCRNNCAYMQEMNYSFVKDAVAGHISLGFSATFLKRVVMDIAGFAGLRYIDGRYTDIPDDATYIEDDFVGFSLDIERREVVPSLGLAFRLGLGW